MLLAIDIGNTNIHFGLHDGSAWRSTWRARTVPLKMGDEYGVLLRNFLQSDGLGLDDIHTVAMASVVPALTGEIITMCERYVKHTPLNVEPGVKTGVRVMVDNPREVGADRVVNAAAAFKLYGAPAVVVDFGTSTNFDVVSASGDYIGGVIAVGIGVAHDALVSRAARLHKVDLVAPPSPIGRNTVHAMQSGLYLGYVSMIEGLVNRVKAELADPHTKVLATGGLAPVMARDTGVIDEITPNLTLDGLRIISELNA